MNPTKSASSKSYLFQVEMLVEGTDNGDALEQIVHALNQLNLADYRILSGIQLGSIIDQRKLEADSHTAIPVHTKQETAKPVQKAAQQQTENGFESIRIYMKSNKLIRLIVNKGFGVKLSIPCRIINFDEDTNVVTVYHVDEKQVYTFRLNEIEDFQE
ncbi:hypothetical protein [Paenibacillus sp. NEAU-GSW1]|uniref:hypothetical protein n=1 Tax=Paenibacillus sp. NEAU-GSW1 TaxID=2682486 RepID=UPI0012E188DB|nr:hypothetical protein [Paenibacillus sp. NEAU-GSW1]MUT64431.1 hypothetical protein [Paenibacillus sp. NEAU-GSW1]